MVEPTLPSRRVLIEALLAIRTAAARRGFVVLGTDPHGMTDEAIAQAVRQLEALIRRDAMATMRASA